jgi:hypothetical protein
VREGRGLREGAVRRLLAALRDYWRAGYRVVRGTVVTGGGTAAP